MLVLNNGNTLMHGKVILEAGQHKEIPNEIAKMWIKMGQKIEVLSDKSAPAKAPKSAPAKETEASDKTSETKDA